MRCLGTLFNVAWALVSVLAQETADREYDGASHLVSVQPGPFIEPKDRLALLRRSKDRARSPTRSQKLGTPARASTPRRRASSANPDLRVRPLTASPAKADKPKLERTSSEDLQLKNRPSSVILTGIGQGVVWKGEVEDRMVGGAYQDPNKRTTTRVSGRKGAQVTGMFTQPNMILAEAQGDEVKIAMTLKRDGFGFATTQQGTKEFHNDIDGSKALSHEVTTPMVGRPVSLSAYGEALEDVRVVAQHKPFDTRLVGRRPH